MAGGVVSDASNRAQSPKGLTVAAPCKVDITTSVAVR
jgi:hypothetical protein